jgi:diguanylate cyclase
MKLTDFDTDLSESVQNLKRVLPLMSKQRVPTTPGNYALWYDYVTRANDGLCRDLEDLLRTGAPITPDISRELFVRYFKLEDVQAEELRHAVGELVGNMVEQLGDLGMDINHYQQFLGKAGDQLNDNVSATELRALVHDLVQETRSVKERGALVERSLQSISQELGVLRTEVQRLNRDSMTDALTQIGNRRAFDHGIDTMVKEAQRGGVTLCLVLIDIDHFKKFNDSYGHQVGDKVLQFVARELNACVKGRDLACRYGGEEFALLLPNTRLEGAYALMDGIRALLEVQSRVEPSLGDNVSGVTVSAGVSMYAPGETTAAFIERADKCLYASKERGRNRVTTETGLAIH